MSHEHYIRRCLALAEESALSGGGPFAAIVVRNGEVISEGCNNVARSHDPTAHAEVVAIRAACEKLGTHQLTDCIIYSSCEPCPMCLGAVYWARPTALYYAADREGAAKVGFDDGFIYDQVNVAGPERQIPFIHFATSLEEEMKPFYSWRKNEASIKY